MKIYYKYPVSLKIYNLNTTFNAVLVWTGNFILQTKLVYLIVVLIFFNFSIQLTVKSKEQSKTRIYLKNKKKV